MATSSTPQYTRFPVGTPGKPWGEAEKKAWLGMQSKKRDYFTEVVSPLLRVNLAGVKVFQYGELDYHQFGSARFPLYAARTADWKADQPMVLVTGGVHGYETSGVQGSLLFISRDMEASQSRGVNVLVLPCLSPWGYECVQRWNPLAIDPNRQFNAGNPGCVEAAQAMAVVAEHIAKSKNILMHVDCHETTDTDNSEFSPAKFARDGIDPLPEWDEIPDGFYLVGDSARPEAEFQKFMIEAVKKVTHIAEADPKGNIIGVPVDQFGVINYPGVGLCGNHTAAKFVTTTEVYPDSPKATPEQCNEAQAACITSGLEYALAHQ